MWRRYHPDSLPLLEDSIILYGVAYPKASVCIFVYTQLHLQLYTLSPNQALTSTEQNGLELFFRQLLFLLLR